MIESLPLPLFGSVLLEVAGVEPATLLFEQRPEPLGRDTNLLYIEQSLPNSKCKDWKVPVVDTNN